MQGDNLYSILDYFENNDNKNKDVMIYNASFIMNIFKAHNVIVEHVDTILVPQYVIYYFNFQNLLDYKVLNDVINELSYATHLRAKEVKSDKSHFAIALDREEVEFVPIDWLRYSKDFNSNYISNIYLGKSSDNKDVVIDLRENPHILVAGASGSGKSVCLNTIITSLMFNSQPAFIRMVMIDPKYIELSQYKDSVYLEMPIINDVLEAKKKLERICSFMDERYEKMQKYNIKEVGSSLEYPRILVVIDEYADLVLKDKTIEDYVSRIAQKGRACAISLIIATQRPTSNIITGLIKSNLTTRIALKTASMRDSMNILDHAGAEKLRGNGDSIVKIGNRVDELQVQIAYTREKVTKEVIQVYNERVTIIK